MTRKPIHINVHTTAHEIGWVEVRRDDPTIFDGWLEFPDEPADKLIASGESEAWVRFAVLRKYVGITLSALDASLKGVIYEAVATQNSERLEAAMSEMDFCLLVHFRNEKSDS